MFGLLLATVSPLILAQEKNPSKIIITFYIVPGSKHYYAKGLPKRFFFLWEQYRVASTDLKVRVKDNLAKLRRGNRFLSAL